MGCMGSDCSYKQSVVNWSYTSHPAQNNNTTTATTHKPDTWLQQVNMSNGQDTPVTAAASEYEWQSCHTCNACVQMFV